MTMDRQALCRLIDELLRLEPMDMLTDPRFLALDDDEHEELFYAVVPETQTLHERDNRADEILRALTQSGFVWRGSKQPKHLTDLKQRAENAESMTERMKNEAEYQTELLKTLTYLNALSDSKD